MSNSIKEIAAAAKKALDKVDNGKEYFVSYINNRLEQAIDISPHDPVIRGVSSVIKRMASSGKKTINQKEIYQIYNQFAGMRSNSDFRDILQDLLYKTADSNIKISNETNFSFRTNEKELDTNIDYNPLNNVFDKNKQITSYYDPSLAKIGVYKLSSTLSNIGLQPDKIDVFGGNDSAILYNVKYSSKLGTTNVAIPLEIENGSIQYPSVFYNNGKFSDLTFDNINKYIIKNASLIDDLNVDLSKLSGGIKTSSSIFKDNLVFEEDFKSDIKLDPVKLPKPLVNIASFEDAVMDASTHFSPELVKTAKSICIKELHSMGFGSQVKLHDALDDCIICEAEIDSSTGKTSIKIPVEVVNNRPQLPSVFYHDEDKVHEFNKEQLSSFLMSTASNESLVSRYPSDISLMNFPQLRDEIISGVSTKNYARAEHALNVIEDKYGSDYHKAAMSDYAKYLTHASSTKIEHKCKLLITKGSLIPRCGHYNVSIDRVTGDEHGNCILKERQAKYDNLASVGATMSTSKIKLT